MHTLLQRSKKYVRELVMFPRRARLRRQGLIVGAKLRIYGRLHVDKHPRSTIVLGSAVVLNATAKRNTLEARGPVILKTVRPGATITVGDDTGITSSTISSSGSVTIGARTLVGAGVLVTDSDHHIVTPPPGTSRRHLGLPPFRAQDAVVIGDDVFIGAHSIVLKGVRVGAGSVIGAGSVVTDNIPPGVIAAGNPCRVIRTL